MKDWQLIDTEHNKVIAESNEYMELQMLKDSIISNKKEKYIIHKNEIKNK